MGPLAGAAVFLSKVGAAVVAAYKASAIVRAVVLIAASFAASMAATALAGSKGMNQGVELQLKMDPTMPRQVAVGRTATGGSLVYAFTDTDDARVPNKYLTRIIALSDRPINSVLKIMDGDIELTFMDNIYGGLARCNQHRAKDDTVMLWVHVVKGSDTPTALPYLITNSKGEWTNQHKGVGISYAIIQMYYDTDGNAFPTGEPQLIFHLEGASVYDDREAVSQDPDDPDTWEYSNNASLLAAQHLRGFRTNGVLIVGAQADERDFSTNNLIAAANTCDQELEKLPFGFEPRYAAGMMLTSSNAVQEDLVELQKAMDGRIYDRGGMITIVPGATYAPVMDLTDDDVNWTEEQSMQPLASLSSLYNAVSGSYVPESQNFYPEPYPTRKSDAYVDLDGGENITLNQDFKAVSSDGQVQRITTRILASSRFQTVVGFVGPLWLIELEQGDWFTFTSARWGFVSKVFVVEKQTITTDLKVVIVAKETSTTIDGWDVGEQFARTDTVSTRSPYTIPTPELSLTPVTLTSGDTILPAITYTVEIPTGSPANAFDLRIRRYSVAGDAPIYQLPTLTGGNVSGTYAQGLLPATQYQMSVRANDGQREGEWSFWYNVTTHSDYQVPVANEVVKIGFSTPAEIEAGLAHARASARSTAEALIRATLDAFNTQQRLDELTHVDGQQARVVLIREITERIEGQTAILEVISLMGAVNDTGTAFILDLDKVMVTPSESLAFRFESISSSFEDVYGDITNEAITRSTEDGVINGLITNLTLVVNGHTGTITTFTTQIGNLEGAIQNTWGVLMDIDGYWAGFQLQQSGGPGTVYSELKILANALKMYDPISNSAIPIFTVTSAGLFVGTDKVATESVVANALRKRYATTLATNSTLPTAQGSKHRFASVNITKDRADSAIDVMGTCRLRMGSWFLGRLVVGYTPSGGGADVVLDQIEHSNDLITVNGNYFGGAAASINTARSGVGFQGTFNGLAAGNYTFWVEWWNYNSTTAGSFVEAGTSFTYVESKRAS